MKKLTMTCLALWAVFLLHAQITPTQVGMIDFKVQQNLSTNDMNGTNDVSTKLENAINYAKNQNQVLFIPGGTYKVSKSIVITTKTGEHSGNNCVVIVGDKYSPPLIKLANNSSDFQNGSTDVANGPRAIFTLKPDQWSARKSDWLYYAGIRGINFDLGTGNPGAIAISWPSAQHCFVEDIEINANGAWAGIAGIPGANALVVNVKVVGGKYGIYGTRSEDTQTLFGHAASNTLVGLVLQNQTHNALRLHGWGGINLVGVDIIKNNGTAIWIKGSSHSHDCPLSIVDARIEFSSSSGTRAIDNGGKSTIALRDVYTRNAEVISHNNNENNHVFNGDVSSWTHTIRFNFITNKSTDGTSNGTGRHHVNGNLQGGAVVDKTNATPPSDIVSKHIYPFTPSFQDPGVYVVNTSGGNHRQKIQDAINSHQKVMLAAGDYYIDGPIVLKSNTVLFGVPGPKSNLINAESWNPSSKVWLIHTENSANATTYLMDIGTRPNRSNSYWGGVHWRAGKNSIVRNCSFGRYYGVPSELDVQRVLITDNGGGRWYNYQDHKQIDNNGTTHNNHRRVLVSGTSQPLTFYGLNLERGGASQITSSYPMMEILNSSNVRVFGAKGEVYQPYALINNSHNIYFANIQDWGIHQDKAPSYSHFIVIQNSSSSNIEIANAQWSRPPNTSYKIVSDPWTTNTPNRREHLGLYRKGAVDMSVFSQPVGPTYTLTVSSGSGGGNYSQGTVVSISANAAPVGKTFDKWTGNTSIIANVNSASTTVTMPASNTSVTATYKDVVREPYIVQDIPGKIEVEHYDHGGQGVAYNDDGLRQGDGAFRPSEFVDVVAKASASNGYSIGYSNSGEWVEYTLANVASGNYNIILSYASGASTLGQLRVSLNGTVLTTFTNLSNTGGWVTFANLTASNISVSGGTNRVLRLEYVNGADFDIDAIEFVALNPTYTLNVSATNGSVAKNPNKASYDSGESVTLTATANSGYTFSSWSGDATGSTNPLTIAMNGNKSITANFTANPVSYTQISKTSTAVTIDGTKDAAYVDPTRSLNNTIIGTFSTGATWTAIWDNTYLYVFMEVVDAQKVNDSGTQTWNDDGTEIYIDGNNSKGTSYDGANDLQYILRWNDSQVYETKLNRVSGVTMAEGNSASGYTKEIRIPWTTIGVTPSTGMLVGMEFMAIDDDNGGVRDGKIAWHGTTDNAWQNPSLFGTVQLGVLNNPATIPVTGVSVTPTQVELYRGNTQQLTRSIQPTNATNQNVSWSSSNTSVATVNASGLVTAQGLGSANITVTTTDGGYTASCAVQVIAAYGSHVFNPTDDLYTENGTVFNNTELRIENAGRQRITYMRFNLTGIEGWITNAQLKLTETPSENGSGTFRVYLGSHSNWGESNFSSLPTMGSQLGSFSGTVNYNQLITISLAGLPTSGAVTLIVHMDAGGNDISVHSRQGTTPPRLEISTEKSAMVGMVDSEQTAIQVYPNPVADVLYLTGTVDKLSLHDIMGKTLKTSMNASELSVAEFSSGVYLLRYSINNKEFVSKIVKK